MGGFRARRNASEVSSEQFRISKARALVAMLAMAPEHRLHREEIIDLLWPELDLASASSNLRYALFIARRTLQPLTGASPDFLVRQGDFIELNASLPLEVDVQSFEYAASVALETEDAELVQAAIDLYGGELLPEDRYEDWALVRRERLRAQYLNLLALASAHAEEAGDIRAAIDLAVRLLQDDRLNEEAHQRLMRLYALNGRRSDALRQYRALEAALRQDLDVEPDAATRQLHADILAYRFGDAAPSPSVGQPGTDAEPGQHTLPRYLTRFIGRRQDIETVSEMLRTHRLVTLSGLGGVGKTRLAADLARLHEDTFVDAVRVVDLTAVLDSRVIWPAILAAFNAGDEAQDDDAAAIAARQALLLLDNCEHMAEDIASIVTALLDAGEELRILATSREVLRVSGEAVWSVAPLEVPESGSHVTLDDVRASDAASLFLDRLRLRQPQVELTDEVARHVIEICQQLDGLPLALEMAAARAASISLPDLSARLGNAPAVLASSDREAPERHGTLQAMLDWSYELLNIRQQVVFSRLSVFAGSWTLDSAELIAIDEEINEMDVLDTLAELVDKSLLVRDGDALDVSYRYLAPVQQYAAQRLEESGAAGIIRRRHAEAFLALAETAGPHLRGPEQPAWMERLGRNSDNLRSAIRWALSADPAFALRLAVALGRFWYVGGHLREGRETFNAVLAAAPEGTTELQAQALFRAGILADEAGEMTVAESLLQRSLALFREQGEPADIASVLNSLGVVAWANNDLTRARARLEECLEIRRNLGDKKVIASTLGNLALIDWSRGDLQTAREQQEESLALATEAGDTWSVAIGIAHLGRISWEQADYHQARNHFIAGLRLAHEVGDRGAVAEGLEGVAGALAALGDAVTAARLWGSAEEQRRELNIPIPPPELPLYERMVATGRQGSDPEMFADAWQAGRQQPVDALVAELLAAVLDDGEEGTLDTPWESLTSRQRQIAELVARDLTNQQIAEELGIAHRTVDTHVSNILQALGCRSRAEVAQHIPR